MKEKQLRQKEGMRNRCKNYIRFYSAVRVVGTAMLAMLVILIGLTVAPIYHQADSAKAAAGTAAASTLTFTSTNATASVSLAVNSANGTFATSTEAQKAAFSISTNNFTGYTVSVTASGSATTLSDGGSHTIASIGSATSLSNFQDTGTTGQALNNKWGYIPSYYNSATNTTNYYPAPTSASATTLRVTSSANDPDGVSNPDEYAIGLGLRADYANPSGTYTNSTFLIQYVANAINYMITYSDGGLSGVSGIPAVQSGSVTSETIALSAATPARSGYTFGGWCLGTLNATGTTCTGTTFAPGGDFGLDSTIDNTSIVLNALWKKIISSIDDMEYMQDFATLTSDQVQTVMNSMELNRQYQLEDNRDNTTYFIARQMDGNVWMTQNLDLCISCTNVAALTSLNTDLNVSGSGAYSDGYSTSNDVITWAPASTAKTSDRTLTSTTTSISSSIPTSNYTAPYSVEGGDTYVYTSGTTSSDTVQTKAQCEAAHTDGSCGHYQVGNYYTWSAAIASNNSANISTQYATASNSICPAGWRLPVGQSSSSNTATTREYGQLFLSSGVTTSISISSYAALTAFNASGFTNIRTNPLYLTRGGALSGTSLSGRNSYGYYWTSSVSSSNYAYNMYFRSSDVYSANTRYRYYAQPIRCLVRQTTSEGSNTVITFDKNADDATGTMNNQTINSGTSTSLTSNAYARSGFVFNGWNTKADGTGVTYNNSASFTGLAGSGTTNVILYAQWAVQVTIKTATGISTVRIRDSSNNNICSASSTSGTACKLKPSTTYNLAISLATGYDFSSWSLSGGGTLSSTTSSTPTYTTPASGTATITPSATPREYAITVNFIGGVSSVQFTNSTYGTKTVSTSGSSVQLRYNQTYNITVTLNNGNYFVLWEQTTGSGTIGSTSTMNTTFKPAAGNSTLRITAANTKIQTADGIDNVTITTTGGSTVCTATNTTGTYCNLTLGTTYNLTATLHQGYSFGSWSHTGSGTIANNNTISTTFTAAQSSAIDVITPSATGNPYTLTIVFGNANVTSVTVDGETFTTSGGTKTLTAGTAYTISGTTDLNTVAFSASANGVVSGNTFTLYGDATLTAEGLSRIYMQNMNSSLCTATPTEVYDIRDDTPYMVARLADGNCWMLDNLALNLTDSTVQSVMYDNTAPADNYSVNTNAKNSSLNKLFNGGGATSDKYATSAVSTNWGETYSYSDPRIYTALKDSVYSNDSLSNDAKTWKYGIYYNYCAVSAGSYCYGNGTSAGTSSGNATEDICPAGWHMPSGNTSGDYYSLYNGGYGYNTAPLYRTALHLPLSGYVNSGSPDVQGSTGNWWSTTRGNSSYMYSLYVTASLVNPTYRGNRNVGRSARCLLSS